MVSAWVLSVAMSTTAVPPGQIVENHAHPGHYTQPEVRRYERYPMDNARRLSWEAYTKELDTHWKAYRAAGSTPEAFAKYKQAALEAKQRYVYNDPYYIAIEP